MRATTSRPRILNRIELYFYSLTIYSTGKSLTTILNWQVYDRTEETRELPPTNTPTAAAEAKDVSS